MLANLTSRTKLRMTGADRERYLGGQVTNDVRGLQPGSATLYACVTNAKGRLEADIYITATEDAYLIDADPSLREILLARLEKYIIADDVTLEDITEEYSLFHASEGPTPVGLAFAPNALISPSNRFGTEGTDYWTTTDAVTSDITFTLDTELEALRISHAIPKWGAELTPDILPPEAGLEDRAISYTKGCYIGQEIISRIRSVGKVNKQLVAMRAVDPGAPLEPGLELFTESAGKPIAVGILTSCAANPSIALGYVKTAHNAPGKRLTAGTPDDPLAFPVEISSSPLILQDSES